MDKPVIAVVSDALRDALWLCGYLQRIWPEVGSLPSVATTRAKATTALELLNQAHEGCDVCTSLRDLAEVVERLRATVEER